MDCGGGFGGGGVGFSVRGSRFSVLCSWFAVLGSRFSVLGYWFLVLGSWFGVVMLVGYLCDANCLFLFSVGEMVEWGDGAGDGAGIDYE